MCDKNKAYTWVCRVLMVSALLLCLFNSPNVAAVSFSGTHKIDIDTGINGAAGGKAETSFAAQGIAREMAGLADAIDLSAYANDFNMQDEASIPEDILDQQHIGDPDGIDTSPESGDSDAADIILETQRNSAVNFTNGIVVQGKARYGRLADDTNRNGIDVAGEEQPVDIAARKGQPQFGNEFNSDNKKYSNENFNGANQTVGHSNEENVDYGYGTFGANPKSEHNGELAAKHKSTRIAVDKKFKDSRSIENGWEHPVGNGDDGQGTQATVKLNEAKSNASELLHGNQQASPFVKVSESSVQIHGVQEDGREKLPIGDIREHSHNEDEVLGKNHHQLEKQNGIDTDGYLLAEWPAATSLGSAKANSKSSGAADPVSVFITPKAKRYDGARTTIRPAQRYSISNSSSQGIYDRSHSDNNEALAEPITRSIDHDGAGQNMWQWNAQRQTMAKQSEGHQSQRNAEVQSDYIARHSSAPRSTTNRSTASIHSQRVFDAANEVQNTATLQTQQQAASFPSAFELHKAQRRISGHYGHRSQKKRYKDYLHYTTVTQASGDVEATSNQSKSNFKSKSTTMNEHRAKSGRKVTADRQQGLPAPPIFAVGKRQRMSAKTANEPEKPFYEGQINYFVETTDDEDDDDENEDGDTDDPKDESEHSNEANGHRKGGLTRAHSSAGSSMDRMISADNHNWYRRVSPVLRNGVKKSEPELPYRPHHSHSLSHSHQHIHTQSQSRAHNHHHTVHRNHHKHRQHNKRPHQRSHSTQSRNPFQRASVLATRNPTDRTDQVLQPTVQTPLPPLATTKPLGAVETTLPVLSYRQHAEPMQELGHQITQMEEFERYYAKWPHLARVQFQVYDEHFREAHPDLYSDYGDYESAAELEEAQNSNAEDANLPPYIKKFNRRNKQLLNLLEGTLPPATRLPQSLPWSSSILQPGPHDSNAGMMTSVRIDDDYLKAKRMRYHNRLRNAASSSNASKGAKTLDSQHFFSDQLTNGGDSEGKVTPVPMPFAVPKTPPPLSHSLRSPADDASTQTNANADANSLPDEDVDVSAEIETKSNTKDMAGSRQMAWQIEKLTTASPYLAVDVGVTASVPQANPPPPSTTQKSILFRLPSYPAIAGSFATKPRGRSAQFGPSGNAKTRSFGSSVGQPGNGHISTTGYGFNGLANEHRKPAEEGTTMAPQQAQHTKAGGITSFVYHRVVDASPRLVGAGYTGRKQRLPFVAITDRRLETSKKSQIEREKDFEQNHFPMP